MLFIGADLPTHLSRFIQPLLASCSVA